MSKNGKGFQTFSDFISFFINFFPSEKVNNHQKSHLHLQQCLLLCLLTRLKLTPFQASYRYDPPQFFLQSCSTISNSTVDDYLHQRKVLSEMLQQNLLEAQHRLKQHDDKKRVEWSFNVGNWAYLRLQQYRQISVLLRRSLKYLEFII